MKVETTNSHEDRTGFAALTKMRLAFPNYSIIKTWGYTTLKRVNFYVLQAILKAIACDLKVYVNNTRVDFVVHYLQTVYTVEHTSINMRQESIRGCPYTVIFSVITLFKIGFPPSE